jgi:hypothetical protein
MAILALVAAFVSVAAPARAQYQPPPANNVPLGEDFHIEAGVSTWGPSADMSITSGGTGTLAALAGTTIDAKEDLGFVDTRMPMFSVVARPGGGHKFRFQYIPIDYSASATLNRTIVFNGQRYSVGLPVNSTLDWKAKQGRRNAIQKRDAAEANAGKLASAR